MFRLIAIILPVAAAFYMQSISAQDLRPRAGASIQNFPGAIPLDAFVESVGRQLGIKILYDDKLSAKKINIRATGEVPNDSLLGVLQSALRMNGLALVSADVPGWMKIVESAQMGRSAVENDAITAMNESGGNTPVTQAFKLKHADPTTLEKDVKPFLTQGTGNTANLLALKDQRVLIVTDYAANLVRLERLIQLMDQPKVDVNTQFIKAVHLDAETLAENLSQLLAARKKAKGTESTNGSAGVEVTFDARTSQIILVGEKHLVAQAKEYLRVLDVRIDTRTEVYNPVNVAASKIERLITGMIELYGTKPVFRSVVDEDLNLLVVTTTEAVHREIETILKRLDIGVGSKDRNSPVRFYKLKHATAEDVLRTIQELEGTVQQDPAPQDVDERRNGRFNLQPDRLPAGVERPAAQLPNDVLGRAGQLPLAATQAANELLQQAQPNRDFAGNSQTSSAASSEQISLTEAIGQAKITADVSANTLIVIATPEVHQVYEELIEKLDQPRPKVLIEARLVVIDTSDDFSLGVEVSGGDRSGADRLFAFTSFGFSEVDAISGALSLIPGLGFNGTLVDQDVADVVLRALSTHRRSKVISSPRILVNDNATGNLTSVTEVPFSSFNTFNTVSSTSFAGFAEAGTTITVTPHISEDDQLQLEYSITLNEFLAEAGTDGSPPPRQTDEIDSTVTIPDGHTIIVGGLTRTSHSTNRDTLPILEHIPVIKELIGSRSRSWNQTTLFVFLRPVILRDDKFRDLKYYSERDTKASRTPGTYPFSEPLSVR